MGMKMKQRRDIYSEVTQKIVAAIERGEASPAKWIRPWDSGAARNLDGREYRGINSIILGLSGFSSPVFGTFKSLAEANVQVMTGEKGTRVVYYLFRKLGESEDDKRTEFRGIRAYTVFSLSQTDASPKVRAELENQAGIKALGAAVERDARIIAMLERLKLKGGIDETMPFAAYHPARDAISLPAASAFFSSEDWASTAAHEAIHATGAEHRLARNLTGRFGGTAYAMEELIAELGAAMTLSASGIVTVPRADHAHYLSAWLQKIKSDSKAIFTCASKAQAAADLLLTE